jgi:5-methylcytosine-specific restriction endonuclease McrA
MKPKILTEAECDALRRAVAVRDNYHCILHPDRLGGSVHHIVYRSHTKSRSETVWQEKNMCVLCTECHPGEVHSHPREMRVKLLKRMVELYGYNYDDQPFNQYLIGEE